MKSTSAKVWFNALGRRSYSQGNFILYRRANSMSWPEFARRAYAAGYTEQAPFKKVGTSK